MNTAQTLKQSIAKAEDALFAADQVEIEAVEHLKSAVLQFIENAADPQGAYRARIAHTSSDLYHAAQKADHATCRLSELKKREAAQNEIKEPVVEQACS